MSSTPRASRPFLAFALAIVALLLFLQGVSACGQTVQVGLDDALVSGGAGGAGATNAAGSGGTLPLGGIAGGSASGGTSNEAGATCVPTLCRGNPYQCGNCKDDDNDGLVDSEDPDCLGPCDDDEKNLRTGLTVGNPGNCKEDCYFDGDAGPGNDKCSWTHQCDTLSVAPDYPPSGEARCAYDASKATTCAGLRESQPQQCLDVCMPLVPNGCDCFGCCELPAGSNTYYFIGVTRNGVGCELDSSGDPSNCPRCTPVPSCLNRCDPCENCVGRGRDPNCAGPTVCPPGQSACTNSDQCDYREYCVTGCCVRAPEPT